MQSHAWVERKGDPLFLRSRVTIILYFVVDQNTPTVLHINLERNDKLNAWMKKVLVVFELKSKRF